MNMRPETASTGGDFPIFLDGAREPKIERRLRLRAALQWEIQIFRNGDGHPISGRTKNISSQGFYCLLQRSFQPGERLDCMIVIPVQNPARSDDVLYLQCRARVLRVEPGTTDAAFGVACEIEDYHVMNGK